MAACTTFGKGPVSAVFQATVQARTTWAVPIIPELGKSSWNIWGILEDVGSVGSVGCFVGCTLWLFNIAMEAMAHRNRWFTYIKNGDFPWLCYTQSGKSVHRLFENKSQWDAAHSGSHRSQCKIMQISMGRCAPAIICFVSCSVFLWL